MPTTRGSLSLIKAAVITGLLGFSATSRLAGPSYLGWLLGGAAAVLAAVAGLTATPSPLPRELRRPLMPGAHLRLQVVQDLRQAVDPRAVLRADRRAAFVTPLVAGLVSGFTVALWADLAGKADWLVGGLSVAAFCWSGLLLSLRNSAWARFVVARSWLAARPFASATAALPG